MGDNLSGGIIQSVLDSLLLGALTPIVKNGNLFDPQMIYLLSISTRNRKRKVTAQDRQYFIDLCCDYLTTDNTTLKISILAEAKIERSFIFGFIQTFLQETSVYLDLYKSVNIPSRAKKLSKEELKRLQLKISVIERTTATSNLYAVINQVADHYNLALQFRNKIVNNYIRLAYKHARIYCKDKPNHDLDDVHQNFLVIITKAIDKYDSSKGALTSYINWWILNAQTNTKKEHGHEYGIAYDIPQSKKKDLARKVTHGANFSVSLEALIKEDFEGDGSISDDSCIVQNLERDEVTKIVQILAAQADIRGMARLVLDIDHYFSPQELELMQETTLS